MFEVGDRVVVDPTWPERYDYDYGIALWRDYLNKEFVIYSVSYHTYKLSNGKLEYNWPEYMLKKSSKNTITYWLERENYD